MKKPILSCLIVLLASTVVFSKFISLPINERVENSNLILIGTLKDVKESETDQSKISRGKLVVEKIIYGKFVSLNERKLQSGDELQVEWRNSKMFACQFGFSENKNQIWFLDVKSNGEIEPLGPSTASGLNELSETQKLLRKKAVNKSIQKIELQNNEREIVVSDSVNVEETATGFYSAESNKKEYQPLLALLIILSSMFLYYFLYRSRFKIR